MAGAVIKAQMKSPKSMGVNQPSNCRPFNIDRPHPSPTSARNRTRPIATGSCRSEAPIGVEPTRGAMEKARLAVTQPGPGRDDAKVHYRAGRSELLQA